MFTTEQEWRDAQREVAPYWGRDYETGFFGDARARFNVLTSDQQHAVQAIEAEIQAYETARDAKAKRAEDQWRRSKQLSDAGVEISDRMSHALVHDTLDTTEALDAVRAWMRADDHRPWLMISGSVGAGKSVAAAYVITCRDGSVAWFSASEIARVFCSSFSDLVKRADVARKASLLVIDDVGCELDAERMSFALIELLNGRQSNGRQTVATTNLSGADFKQRYPDPRLHSRFVEAVQWVTCLGPDLRRAGAAR